MPRFIRIGDKAVNLDLVTSVTFEPKGCTIDEETGECSPAVTIRQLGDFERQRLTGREATQLWEHVAAISEAPFSHLDRNTFDIIVRRSVEEGLIDGPMAVSH